MYRKNIIIFTVLLTAMLSTWTAAEYFNYNARNIVGDNTGVLSGFSFGSSSSYSDNAYLKNVLNDNTGSVAGFVPRGALVYKLVSGDGQAFDNAADTVVNWIAEQFDNGGWHTNSGADNTKLIVPSGVYWVRVGAYLRLSVGDNAWVAGDSVTIRIRYNDNTYYTPMVWETRTVEAQTPTNMFFNLISGPMAVTAGDYFDIRISPATSGATHLHLGAASSAGTYTSGGSYFWIEEVK